MLGMNLLQIIKQRIIHQFPSISETELCERLAIAEKLLENIG